jgi:adenylylsulfate kinase
LGFSPEDRKENLRRIACVAKLFNENGNFVIASFVSPTDELRQMVKNIIGNFKLVFVKCSQKVCEQRDVKGMYKKARDGEIKDFTGISAPFEEPLNPDIVVDTESNNLEDCVREALNLIGLSNTKKHSYCLLGQK